MEFRLIVNIEHNFLVDIIELNCRIFGKVLSVGYNHRHGWDEFQAF